MSKIVQRILVIALIMAVMGYIIFSHIAGKSDTSFFLVATAMLSYFLISMVRALVEDLRSK